VGQSDYTGSVRVAIRNSWPQRLNSFRKKRAADVALAWSAPRRHQTNGNGCPVPQNGTGRYRFKGKVQGAQLKLAATNSKPRPTFIFPQTVKPT